MRAPGQQTDHNHSSLLFFVSYPRACAGARGRRRRGKIRRKIGNDLFTRRGEYDKLLQPVIYRQNLPPASSPGSHRPVTQPRAHCMKGGTQP
ncbi:hypothetical protein HMPREF0239_00307 [Clostridium sp. ATCC BAA-442]|nr:hypothetical protein HMPREF0239_00307 [Clostridium sp. ATCC BAA-442]